MQKVFTSQDVITEIKLDSFLDPPFTALTKNVNMLVSQNSNSLYERIRLYHIDELSLDDSTPPREALENVFASTDMTGGKIIYLIVGMEDGVAFHFGTVSDAKGASVSTGHALSDALKANFSGIEMQGLKIEAIKMHLDHISNAKHTGMLLGVPSFNKRESDELDYQGIDRVISGMLGHVWQLLIVAEPGEPAEIRETLDALYSLSSSLHLMSKQTIQSVENVSKNLSISKGETDSITVTKNSGSSTSATTSASKTVGTTNNSGASSDSRTTGDQSTNGTSDGTSNATGATKSVSHAQGETTGTGKTVSIEHSNKKFANVVKHLDETLMPRFQLGRAKAMFKTSVYVFADKADVLTRAGGLLRGLFQGDDSHFTPIEFIKLPKPLTTVESYFDRHQIEGIDKYQSYLHSIPVTKELTTVATWLTTRELSLIAGLPACEVPGLRLRKSVDFGVNIFAATKRISNGITLGNIKLRGRALENNPFVIDQAMLNGHVFVTGVTGAGKTKTCQRLLLESGLPFLVLEPAKTEYRELLDNDPSIQFFTPGAEKLAPFRFNPFELLEDESLSGHIDMLKAAFTASFPMEAAMPHLIEQALVAVYKEAGWDIHTNTNYRFEGREWKCNGECWPTLDEFLASLSKVIAKQGLGRELEEKYRGSLQARLGSLLVGAKGKMLNTRNSVDFFDLIKQKAVIELDEIRDEGDKALLMGLIVGRLAEAMKINHKKDKGFQHLTLIEEAHRLLSRASGNGDDPRAHAVGLFTNLLAEVRKYGEGLIIADQIPNKLAPEVIKNTNTKIVHRLFARDDKDAIGDTMGLEDEQKAFLSNLDRGEAIAFCGGWHKPIRVQIRKLDDSKVSNGFESTIKKNACKYRMNHRERLYPWFTRLKGGKLTNELLGDLLIEGEQAIEHLTHLLNSEDAIIENIDYALRYQAAQKRLINLAKRHDSEAVIDMITAMISHAIPASHLGAYSRDEAMKVIKQLCSDICNKELLDFKAYWVDSIETKPELNVICKIICKIK